MGKMHYWFSVILEIVGIIAIFAGRCEILFLHKTNPAELLIWLGMGTFSIGTLIFAKFVNVKHFLK